MVDLSPLKAPDFDFQLDDGDSATIREIDLLDPEEEAQELRQSKLEEKLKLAAKCKARTIDAIEFCLSLRAVELAEYEPELSWEAKPPSDRQIEALAKAGFDTGCVSCRGHASKILDLLFTRRE